MNESYLIFIISIFLDLLNIADDKTIIVIIIKYNTHIYIYTK